MIPITPMAITIPVPAFLRAGVALARYCTEATKLMKKSEDPGIKRMLGVTPGMGKMLGLDEEWMVHAIKTVGNYGEIFERNVGEGSALQLKRGLNDLWTRGGLMYAMPLR